MNYGEKLSALAESFPTLLGAEGVRPFDAELLELQLREGWTTTGSKHAIRFVLSVYDPTRARVDADAVRSACRVRPSGKPSWEVPPLEFEGGRKASGFLLEPLAFNICQAFQVWDDNHRRAAMAWLAAPWWP